MFLNNPVHDVGELLNNWFDYPNKRLYCQVSTTSSRVTHIRTMDLYHLTEDGYIALLSRTDTRKWNDLTNNPNISICIANLGHGQITVEGSASLKTAENDFDIASYYWNNHLDQYWRDFYLKRSDRHCNEIPSSFGVIIVKPDFWEILELDVNDYSKSSRF